MQKKKIDGTGKHYYKQGNPDLERQISYVPFSLRFKSLTFQYLYSDGKKIGRKNYRETPFTAYISPKGRGGADNRAKQKGVSVLLL